MFIPGTLIAALTFPGVIVHELAHSLACRLARIKVYKVCYFQFGDPAGYVIHEQVQTYGAVFLVAVAPFIFNTLVALCIFSIMVVAIDSVLLPVVFLWLGISIGAHSFPSNDDADILWVYSKDFWKHNVLAIFGLPIVIFIKIANALSVFWFDFFYAGFLCVIPFIIWG